MRVASTSARFARCIVSINLRNTVKKAAGKLLQSRYALPISITSRAEFQPLEFAPMIAKVVHFGTDDCHRLMVLRSAGYLVEDCACLEQLSGFLAGDAELDA